MAGPKQQRGRKPADKVAADESEPYEQSHEDETSDGEDGENLKKILSLVGAQFNKKSSDRTKRAETEHLQLLEAKRIELQGQLNAKSTSLQDKLDALKREYDGQAGESTQLLKKIKTGVEKNLDFAAGSIGRVEVSLKESARLRQTFFSSMISLQSKNRDEAVQVLKTMQKDVHATRQTISASNKDTKELKTLQTVFVTGMTV